MKQWMADEECVGEPLLVCPGSLINDAAVELFFADLAAAPSSPLRVTSTAERRQEYLAVASFLRRKYPHKVRGIAYLEHLSVSALGKRECWVS